MQRPILLFIILFAISSLGAKSDAADFDPDHFQLLAQTKVQAKKKRLKKTDKDLKQEPEGVTLTDVIEGSISFIDNSQRFITNQWIGLNYNLDSFFSNQYSTRDQNRSMILAYYGVYKKEREPELYSFDFRVRVHFPNTTKRLKIVIEKERDEILESTSNVQTNVANNAPGTTAASSARNSKYVAGLSYLLPDSKYFQTFVETGMRILLPLDPYMRLRFQREFKNKIVDIFASQSFILYRQDGFSEISQVSFFKKWNDTFQNELINTLSWSDREDRFLARNNLILYHRLDDRKSLLYSAGANALLSPTYYYNSYDASINYRQLIHRDWLFAYLSLGADFPKEHDFRMEKFIMTRLEVFFR